MLLCRVGFYVARPIAILSVMAAMGWATTVSAQGPDVVFPRPQRVGEPVVPGGILPQAEIDTTGLESSLPPLDVTGGTLPLDVLISLGLEPVAVEGKSAGIPTGARWWLRTPDGERRLVSGSMIAAPSSSPVVWRRILSSTARGVILGVEDTVISSARPIGGRMYLRYTAIAQPGYVVHGMWHIHGTKSLSWLPSSGDVVMQRGDVLVPDVVPMEYALVLGGADYIIPNPSLRAMPRRRTVVRHRVAVRRAASPLGAATSLQMPVVCGPGQQAVTSCVPVPSQGVTPPATVSPQASIAPLPVSVSPTVPQPAPSPLTTPTSAPSAKPAPRPVAPISVVPRPAVVPVQTAPQTQRP